jgi:hypothetical protein
MKKFLTLLFTIMLMFTATNLVNAEVSKDGKVKKNVYATAEDILLTIIEPSVEKIIQDKYGQRMSWDVQKATDIGLIIDHTKKESEAWYEIELAINVSSFEKDKPEWALDIIKLKIDTPNILSHRGKIASNEIKELKIDLIDYQQIRSGKPIKN